MARRRVVLVEDEILIRLYTKRQLEKYQVDVVGETGHSDEVIDLVRKTKPDLVFMDIRIEGDRTGLDLAREFAPELEIPVVFVSAYEMSLNDVPEGKWFLGGHQKPLSAFAIGEILAQLEKFIDA